MVKIGIEELTLERLGRPRLLVVLDHWQAIRGSRAMPSRRDVDPLSIKDALGIVMILRYEPEIDDFRFSLYGTEIARSQRVDYTGKLASELQPKPFAELILKSYRHVRETWQPYFGRLVLAMDHELVSYLRIVLPLSDDGEHVDALLVASDHEKAFWQTLYDEQANRGQQPPD